MSNLLPKRQFTVYNGRNYMPKSNKFRKIRCAQCESPINTQNPRKKFCSNKCRLDHFLEVRGIIGRNDATKRMNVKYGKPCAVYIGRPIECTCGVKFTPKAENDLWCSAQCKDAFIVERLNFGE